ncbi:MAG: divergent PAP2 family protein [Caldicoprobacterales bacterium]|nr:divergent PAP2 family protein [Clostridiales bacterium]
MIIFNEILDNKIIWVSLLAWFIAQFIKVLLTIMFGKQLDLTRFVGSGGMPSSHSALVVSMATSIGYANGFNSSIFALSATVALIVMYDAAGVRRAAGKQAAVLNEIVEELQAHRGIREEKLKELLGHTPIEVIAGAALGILIAFIFR